MWVKPWILQRPVQDAYAALFSDLLSWDEISFRNFIRMDLAAFEEVLSFASGDSWYRPIPSALVEYTMRRILYNTEQIPVCLRHYFFENMHFFTKPVLISSSKHAI